MQSLQREQLIRHASGDHRKEFVYGFYLYYVMQGSYSTYNICDCIKATIFCCLHLIFCYSNKKNQRRLYYNFFIILK